MISAANDKGFFAAHWDWLVAAGGFAALAAGVACLVVEQSNDPVELAAEAGAEVALSKRTETGVEKIDMSLYDIALKENEAPGRVDEPPETLGSFLASEKRVFCDQGDDPEHKSCGRPIPADLKVCPFCKTKQPEERKQDLDSDGDGIPDEWERANGMNPNDPADISGDLDGDGFTNLEEFAAKTDPRDPLSHPEYWDSLKLQPQLKQTFTTLVFTRTYTTPAGRKYDFKDPRRINDYDRGNYSVHEGDKIGKSGFVVKGYESKVRKQKMGGGMEKSIDVSEAEIVREKDGKTVRLVIGAKKTPIDVQATLVYERGSTQTFEVAAGDEIDLNGTKYKVLEITAPSKDAAQLKLKNLSSGRVRILDAP